MPCTTASLPCAALQPGGCRRRNNSGRVRIHKGRGRLPHQQVPTVQSVLLVLVASHTRAAGVQPTKVPAGRVRSGIAWRVPLFWTLGDGNRNHITYTKPHADSNTAGAPAGPPGTSALVPGCRTARRPDRASSLLKDAVRCSNTRCARCSVACMCWKGGSLQTSEDRWQPCSAADPWEAH